MFPYLKAISVCVAGLLVLVCCYGAGVFMQFYTRLTPHSDLFESMYSKSVLDRHNRILSVFLTPNEQWHIKSYIPVPDKLRAAVLTYEDKRFESHYGIDILALMRSIKNNLFFSQRTGGSTITMQVVKLYLKPKRTYANKFNEIMQAFALECAYDKDEILSMYLNNAPYGGNIIGYHSAALLYFNKDSASLTWAESALLAVLPNAPGLINLQKNTQILKTKRDALLYKMHQRGYFDEHILSLALREPITWRKMHHRNIAPHISLKLASQIGQNNITTTIDKDLQMRLESKVKQYHTKLLPQGILNLAALVVDTKSGQILSYIGSQDFLDIAHFGQIDGVSAMRSPGSLLKPFLYALSIDEGLIAPESLLVDVPLFFSNFNPQNATKTYAGLVRAQYALQKSLNVPFVKLLQTYGYEKFFFTLQDMAQLKPSNAYTYGLSLILGSKELSMLEIARLYRGLGNYGEFGDLSIMLNAPTKPNKRFFSKGSAYLTLQTLKELQREGDLDYHRAKMAFSWKSGTSYGRKDAWAAGVSPKYTIVVWVGNFTGKANPNIFGASTAGTLLFEILESLPDNNLTFTLPASDLKYIEVDKFSGYTLSDEYKALLRQSSLDKSMQYILYPTQAKPLQTSPFYKKVFLAADKEVDSISEDFIHAKPALMLHLPTNVLAYYKSQHINIAKHLNKQAKHVQFIYPTNGLKIILPKDFDGQKELIINIANLKNQCIAWYLNKTLIHTSNQSSLKLSLPRREHTLSIIGEDGSMDSISFSIE
ncbi:penicillin-binding protein 1C [Helicobacter jaachi]|uniref:peptidoglycan glycosyltransferase n=1 Tax=Helicobacter jaachi TaxID=1677920 RepID=A0A4U8TAQ6_9HELI|nr:penicillin-binding protein 1C [Helicobacter jaachi]TLD96929.1 penicillin-binding protein 1C [Helicobacter jaachi]